MAYPSPSAARPRILRRKPIKHLHLRHKIITYTPCSSQNGHCLTPWRKENPCSIHLSLPFRILTSVHACFSLNKKWVSSPKWIFQVKCQKGRTWFSPELWGALWMGPLLERNSWTFAKLTKGNTIEQLSWPFLGNLSWWKDLLSEKQSIVESSPDLTILWESILWESRYDKYW